MKKKILVFGGTGLLGTHLKKHLKAIYLGSADCNITDEDEVERTIRRHKPWLVVNAAGYTDVAGAEKHINECFWVNSTGARIVAFYSKNLVYISSDYVSCSDNVYARSKEAGEDNSASVCPHLMIIRTSFKPYPYPHKRVPIDMWTSGDYVDVIAPMIAREIANFRPRAVVNVGTGRKRLIDLARKTRNDIVPIKRSDIKGVKLPRDSSF